MNKKKPGPHNWLLFHTFALYNFLHLSADYLIFLIYKKVHFRYDFSLYYELIR